MRSRCLWIKDSHPSQADLCLCVRDNDLGSLRQGLGTWQREVSGDRRRPADVGERGVAGQRRSEE